MSKGKLAGKSPYDLMRATFPAGTVNGAPKNRAMQIIAELESTTRGPYAGCVGYFIFNGNLTRASPSAQNLFSPSTLTRPSATLSRSRGRGTAALLKDGKAYVQDDGKTPYVPLLT